MHSVTSQEFTAYDLPDSPGVYFFKKGADILYIGRATSLRDRVRSYFGADVIETRGRRIVEMVLLVDGLSFQATGSVLEAILLEAALIKEHEPPFNAEGKDNKSFLWVVLTDEEFPRLAFVRGRELALWKSGAKRAPYKVKREFGPYQSGALIREALRLIRRIIPYRDEKCALPEGGGSPRPCFARQIGLCPGTCVGAVSAEEYARTVRRLSIFLSGKVGELKTSLERDMKAAAKEERYEEAGALKKALYALTHVSDVSLLKREAGDELSRGGAIRVPAISRIEAYDIAHISGTGIVGAMTVVADREAKKSAYRIFRIKSAEGGDTGSLKELLSRRLQHEEWGLPDLVVVDGALAQKRVAEIELARVGLKKVPVVCVTKGKGHRPRRIGGDASIVARYEGEILLANAEAHRFALARHRKSRKIA